MTQHSSTGKSLIGSVKIGLTPHVIMIIPPGEGLADYKGPLGAPLCLTFLWWPTVGEQQWMGRSTSLCRSFSEQYTRRSSTFFCSGMAGKVCGGSLSLLLDGPAAAGGAVRHRATKQPPMVVQEFCAAVFGGAGSFFFLVCVAARGFSLPLSLAAVEKV